MKQFFAAHGRKVITAVVALIVAVGGISIVVSDNGPDHPPSTPRRTVTVTIGGGPSGAPTSKIPLSPQAQAIASQQAKEDAAGQSAAAESNLHEQHPLSPAAAQAVQQRAPPQPTIPAQVPQAAQSVPGCTTAIVRNQSSRGGSKIALGVIHWTGSSPTPSSPAGGLAIVRWFDTPAAQASSSEVTDQEGRCWLTVPESQKAWTQAGANPYSVSVEIINAGVQPIFQTPAAKATVVRLMRGWHQRWGIPFQHGAVRQGGGFNCILIRPGFLEHRDLGACGGGHPDLGSYNLDPLIREAAKGSTSTRVRARDRARCRKLQWWRSHGRPGGQSRRNAIARRKLLEQRRLTCVRGHVRASG